MKDMVRFGVVLGVICVVASGLLAGVNMVTSKRIIMQAQAEEDAGMRDVLGQAARFEPVTSGGVVAYYKGLDKDGQQVGIVFKASGKGYSSDIQTLVGMMADGTIIAVKVLSQNETPGLGTRVTEEVFLKQFISKDAVTLGGVQAISGATISSRALMESVKKKAVEVRGLMIK